MDPFRRILVPLDGSLTAESVLDHCHCFGTAFEAKVLLLHVLERDWAGSGYLDGVEWRLHRAEVTTYVEGVADQLRGKGLGVTARVVEGNVAQGIVSVATGWGADLIILSSHGRGGEDRFDIGSIARKVISRAGTSIMLAPGRPPPGEALGRMRYEQVFVPVDCSRQADWALSIAARIAQAGGGRLHMLHVVAVPEYPDRAPGDFVNRVYRTRLIEVNREIAGHYLTTMSEKLASPELRVSSSVLESPSVVQSLTDFVGSASASLMVVTAHGESGDSPWPYGSIAGHLMMHAKLPLLVLQDLPRPATTVPEPASHSAREDPAPWNE
jgi:nucleotide-binding universal stress UspA family protein